MGAGPAAWHQPGGPESMSEFLHMGGYAPYVWTAFGVTMLVLVWNLVAAVRQVTSTRVRLRQRILRRAGVRAEQLPDQDSQPSADKGKSYDAA